MREGLGDESSTWGQSGNRDDGRGKKTFLPVFINRLSHLWWAIPLGLKNFSKDLELKHLKFESGH